MGDEDLQSLRQIIDQINRELLELLNRRAEVVARILEVKCRQGTPLFVPEREQAQLARLVEENAGPLSATAVRHLFSEIFRVSVGFMQERTEPQLRISRHRAPEDRRIRVGGTVIGDAPVLIAGPCAVEDEEQMETVARFLAGRGVRFLRGGAFKPRTSPYAFQGLGLRGLEILERVARRHGLLTVTEVTDTRVVEPVARSADILQVGSRSMYNYELLREVGRAGKPVLLKRGMSATLDEWILAAEHIVVEGNPDVILCERGIRTFEHATRNTLDLSVVPLLRQRCHLPVVVDLSHATGRRDIVGALGRAALAAGANGLMVEVHPAPARARSDPEQQLDLPSFDVFLRELGLAGGPPPR